LSTNFPQLTRRLSATHTRVEQERTAGSSSFILAGIHRVLALGLLLVGALTAICAAYLMRCGYSLVPFWDEMGETRLYLMLHPGSAWRWVWAQHNEHRIVFYKLAFIADMHLFRGRNSLMYVAIFLCQVLLALLLGYALRRLGHARGKAWLACFGVLLYCLFCPSQWENFTWAFQLSFVLVNVWSVIAILSVLLLKQRLETGSTSKALVASAILASAGATFTNGNGIVVWPVIILVAVVVRIPRRIIAVFVLAFLIIGPLYFLGYQSPPGHADPLKSITNPLAILEYVMKYFGGAVIPNAYFGWAQVVGEAALLIALAWFWILLRRGGSLYHYLVFGILIYCIGTAFITALGRIIFGTDQALASRYQTLALLFWFGLISLALTAASERRAQLSSIALSAVILLLTAGSATQFPRTLQDVVEGTRKRDTGAAAMITGVHDDRFLADAVFPDAAQVWSTADLLRSRNLSIFATSAAADLGQPLASKYQVASQDRCLGYIDVVARPNTDAKQIRVEGWAVDRETRRPLETVLLVLDGEVVGYGVSGKLRPDVEEALRSKRALHSGWVAYADLPAPAAKIAAYGLLAGPGREVCRVSEAETR
jgi:hypothetical protein